MQAYQIAAMADLTVELSIDRPRGEVLRWWTGFPDRYVATDRREQPHRIEVTARAPQEIRINTFWRTPVGMELCIPEVVHLHDDGNFDIDVHLPGGLTQVDRFRFRAEDTRTRLTLEIDLRARHPLLWPWRAAWLIYARRTYPATFRTAARLCERDAPRDG